MSWDVRTKHVTYDAIPTLDIVNGLAVYGPGATLFTLGKNTSVQQFDLNTPSRKVASTQHTTGVLPPSPPISIEERAEREKAPTPIRSTNSTPSVEQQMTSDEEHSSGRWNQSTHKGYDSSGRYDTASPISSRSGSSVSRSDVQHRPRQPNSVLSKPQTERTYISGISSAWKSQHPYTNTASGYRDQDLYSQSSRSSRSSARSGHRPSRLRHEVTRSPQTDTTVKDLFKYTRARLSDLSYKLPMQASNQRLTNNDLRRQMLKTIFGWGDEVEDLIRDELSRHATGSSCKMFLSKWLGEDDPDFAETNTADMSSSDWMLLALSGIGAQATNKKLGRMYVSQLLKSGDVHAAATITITLGDHNDAIEIYLAHKKYMEALILTCLAFPAVWERQAAIVKKWGEWAVQHGQQQLAIRW